MYQKLYPLEMEMEMDYRSLHYPLIIDHREKKEKNHGDIEIKLRWN